MPRNHISATPAARQFTWTQTDDTRWGLSTKHTTFRQTSSQFVKDKEAKFDNVDISGDVEPSKLATKGETGRLNLQQVSRAQTGRCLGELDRLFGHDSGRVWYSMTAEYEVMPHLYDPSLYYHPIKYTSHLNQIGTYSLLFRIDVFRQVTSANTQIIQ